MVERDDDHDHMQVPEHWTREEMEMETSQKAKAYAIGVLFCRLRYNRVHDQVLKLV